MLAFFRKYQKFFYILITVVIVISFSFFGTYGAMTQQTSSDPEAFRAVDGNVIYRSDLERMVIFLGTDAEDKIAFGGAWGPNFLNDGVVVTDFLKTELATILFETYGNNLKEELATRFNKERRYTPYVHPQARFVSAEVAWNYFAPDLKRYYDAHRQQKDPSATEAFDTRVHLYLAQREFPPATLRQVLRYQESQQDWIKQDRRLQSEDLSLFGYHTLNDWFGKRFLQLISQFIINASIIAENHGYHVSKEEALADLLQHNETSFQQIVQSRGPVLGSPAEYYREQLRRMGMSQDQAVRIWQRVLQFRRLFEDYSSSVALDTLAYQQFGAFANQGAEVEMYQLPESLRFPNIASLFRFEVYLDAIANRGGDGEELLTLPTTFKRTQTLEEEAPQLLQKRYFLNVAEVNKKNLESRVALRDLVDWQLQDEGWKKLKERFPALATGSAATSDERLERINALEEPLRQQVQAFTRRAIVDQNPDWLAEALANAPKDKIQLNLFFEGGALGLKGVKDRQALMRLLDNAPITYDDEGVWMPYTGDQEHFYRIRVLDRDEKPIILTFGEAEKFGLLHSLVQKKLDTAYRQARGKDPRLFQDKKGNWKESSQVAPLAIEEALQDLLKAIEEDYVGQGHIILEGAKTKKDLLASKRFYRHLRNARAGIESRSERYVALQDIQDIGEDRLPPRHSVADQWKLRKSTRTIDRSAGDSLAGDGLFAMNEGDWSAVKSPDDGDLAFYRLIGFTEGGSSVAVKVDQGHRLLMQGAYRKLMRDLIADLKQQKAISFDQIMFSEPTEE